MYVLIVTEVLEDWEDSVNIGKSARASGKLRTLAFQACTKVGATGGNMSLNT